MTVTPASYGFGNVKDGMKAIKVIVVHNYQTNSVSLSEGFSGPNAGDFSVTGGTCTSTLAKMSVCTMIVTFAPTAIGTESATMTVTDAVDPLGPVHGFIQRAGNDTGVSVGDETDLRQRLPDGLEDREHHCYQPRHQRTDHADRNEHRRRQLGRLCGDRRQLR